MNKAPCNGIIMFQNSKTFVTPCVTPGYKLKNGLAKLMANPLFLLVAEGGLEPPTPGL